MEWALLNCWPVLNDIFLLSSKSALFPIKNIFVSGFDWDFISFNHVSRLLKEFSLSIEYTNMAKETLR